MMRALFTALRIFIAWTLTSIGIAHAQDFNAAENAAVITPRSFDVNSVVSAPAQDAPLPNATQRPVVVQPQHVEVSSSFDADSLGDRSANFEATFAPFGNDASGLRFRAA